MFDLNVIIGIVAFLMALEQRLQPRESQQINRAILRLVLARRDGGVGLTVSHILQTLFPTNWRGLTRMFACSALLSLFALITAATTERYQLAWQAHGTAEILLHALEFTLIFSALFAFSAFLSASTTEILRGKSIQSVPVFLLSCLAISMFTVVASKTLLLAPLVVSRATSNQVTVPLEVALLSTPEGYVRATVIRKITREERRLLKIIKTKSTEVQTSNEVSRAPPDIDLNVEPMGRFSQKALTEIESEERIFQRLTRTLNPSDVCGRPIEDVVRNALGIVTNEVEFKPGRRVECPAMATYATAATFKSAIMPAEVRLQLGFRWVCGIASSECTALSRRMQQFLLEAGG